MSDTVARILIEQGGLLIILGAGYRKVWLFRHQYDETCVQLKAQYDQMVALKDSLIAYRDIQIAEREREITRERERADQKEQYAFRLLETAKQSADIASAVLAARKDGAP
jgi:hypothetical protein